jgi:hypothetical protein
MNVSIKTVLIFLYGNILSVSLSVKEEFHQPAFLIRAWMLIFNIGFSLHVASQRLLSDMLPPALSEPTHHRKMDPPYRYFVTMKAPV